MNYHKNLMPINNHNQKSKNRKQVTNLMSNWTEIEQLVIFQEFKKHTLKWKVISKIVEQRSENSVKSFFYSSIRKIRSMRYLKYLKLMICFPTFRNNSKINFF